MTRGSLPPEDLKSAERDTAERQSVSKTVRDATRQDLESITEARAPARWASNGISWSVQHQSCAMMPCTKSPRRRSASAGPHALLQTTAQALRLQRLSGHKLAFHLLGDVSCDTACCLMFQHSAHGNLSGRHLVCAGICARGASGTCRLRLRWLSGAVRLHCGHCSIGSLGERLRPRSGARCVTRGLELVCQWLSSNSRGVAAGARHELRRSRSRRGGRLAIQSKTYPPGTLWGHLRACDGAVDENTCQKTSYPGAHA